MDIANLKFNEAPAARMQLLHPVEGTVLVQDGEEMYIEVYGADSDVYRKAMRQYGNKQLNTRGKQKKTIEELEQVSTSLLAQITCGWKVFIDGEWLEFSPAAVKALYTDYSWIKEQVDEFVNDRANFLANA